MCRGFSAGGLKQVGTNRTGGKFREGRRCQPRKVPLKRRKTNHCPNRYGPKKIKQKPEKNREERNGEYIRIRLKFGVLRTKWSKNSRRLNQRGRMDAENQGVRRLKGKRTYS